MLFHKPQTGVFFAFCLYSFSFGALFPRIGDLQTQMNVSQSTLGFSIIGISIGVQLALIVAGRITDTFGYKKVMLTSVPFIGLSEALAATATTPLFFFTCLLFTGFAIGLVEVAVNVEADRVEHHLGRRIMNRSHAFWSFGFFLAGMLGAVVAQFGVEAWQHLAALFVITTAISCYAFSKYQPAAPRPSDGTSHQLFVKPTKPIMILVLLSLSAMLLEGAGIDWSVIFMRDIFGTPPIVNGLALALFAISQFAVRFVADSFVEKYGAFKIAIYSIFVMGIGVVLVSTSYFAVMALTGFALIGAGSAVIFPLTISAAAQLKDRNSALNVASFAQFSFVVFLLAPPILGTVAEYFGIRISYAIGLPLIVISLMTVSSLRSR